MFKNSWKLFATMDLEKGLCFHATFNLFSQKWFNHGEDSMENDWLIYQMDPTNFQWKGILSKGKDNKNLNNAT